MHISVTGSLTVNVVSVNYVAKLEDGTVVSKGDGVEFTVENGMFEFLCSCSCGIFGVR